MSRKTAKAQVLTANALLSGEPVWLDERGDWSVHMADARLLEHAGQAEQLLDWAQGQQHEVVAPYLVDAQGSAAGPQPTHFREAFRRRGPGNRHHGKQARACAAAVASGPADSRAQTVQ